MIDTKWRKLFQPLFNLLARPLVRLRVTPDTITWTAFALGLMAGLCLAIGYPVIALILLWLSGLLDVLDGTVARLTGNTSKKGAYLDLILDRMVESAMILGFVWARPDMAFAGLLFFTAVLFNFTTFIVAGALFANQGNKSMHYDVGLAERTETFLVFSLLILIPAASLPILLVFDVIIFLTGVLRFIRIIRHQRESQRE
ncbi:MAG: CDP-alcohol phosphatidyltransferase family protein [Bacillota bacterium]|nr:CDP-alcohol phosphatidyltransferase family protein [Bacillota bacterium]